MLVSIHTVVHCYAAELPQFATFLRYQLSSLVLHPPRVDHLIEIRYSSDDELTSDVANEFVSYFGDQIKLSPMQPPERLFRRAIGRNEAALSSYADLVWFSDCDYLFGLGCLDGLWKAWTELDEFVSMLFPNQILTMKSHKMGDDLAEKNLGRVVSAPIDLFKPQSVYRAFGGLQIVPGSLARKYGYLNGSRRYQKPLAKPFANFHDDVAFRKSCLQHGPILPVSIPNLYRLRHTKSTYYG